MTFNTKIPQELEIRGAEVKEGKRGNTYLVVRLEDIATGEALNLVDKDITKLNQYTKGVVAYFYINITLGRFNSIEIEHFEKC